MRGAKRPSGPVLAEGRRRVRHTGRAALALLCATAVAALVLAYAYHLGVAATVVTILIGVPALYLAWAGYRDAETGVGESLAQIADDLADAVRHQWELEAPTRSLNDPYPLALSWAAADPSLADSWDSLVKLAQRGAGWPGRPGQGTWAAGPDGLAGRDGELADVLSRVPTGRLVVLGEPGAGKTMLMVRLVLDLLGRRHPGDAVPVLAGLASWDPARQDLQSWLAAQLAIDHPALAEVAPLGSSGGSCIQALLARRLIVPVLDGLDEIPEPVRGLAITLINDAMLPGEQLVVTCRTEHYRAVARPRSGGAAILRATAAVQLSPLKSSEVMEYLCHDSGAAGPGRWAFLNHIGAKSPVWRALETPLMVGLAKAIYGPRAGEASMGLRDPAELLDATLPDQKAVETRLLDQFVPAAYERRPGSPPPRWSPERAQRWLGFLADYLERNSTADLAWWRLSRAVRGWRPLGVAVRSMLLFAAVWWLAVWLLHFNPQWRHGFGLAEVLAGGPLGRQLLPLVSYLQGLVPEHLSHAVRSTAGSVIGFFPWRSLATLELWVALLGGGVGLLSVVFDSRVHSGDLRVRKVRSVHAPRSYIRALAAFMLASLSILLLPLLLLLYPGLTIRHNGQLILGTLFHMRSVWLLLLLIVLWELPGSLKLTEPVDLSRSVGPSEALRLDRQASFLAVVPTRVIRILLIWVCFGPLVALACGIYLVCFLLCKMLLGRGSSESDRFADARIWLVLGRRMPLKIMKFLADAHRREILRQSGTVYQFRHVRLQEQVAVKYPRISRKLAAAAPFNIRGYQGPLWASATVCGIGRFKGPLWKLACVWSPNSTAPWSQPFWTVRFQAFARRALIRFEPTGSVRSEGPGCVQTIRTLDSSGPGRRWVVCALPGREPVLVAERLWQALRAAGAEALRKAGHKDSENALCALGFPVQGASRFAHGRRRSGWRRIERLLIDGQMPGIVDADAAHVELAAGSWGDGYLVRDNGRPDWHWEPAPPEISPSAGSSQAARHGSRLQIQAELRYSTTSRLALAPGRYDTFLAKLEDSDLSRAIAELFARRGTEVPEVRWRRASGDSRWLRFTLPLAGPRKDPSAGAAVTVHLIRLRPGTLVIASAQLLVEDVAAWREFLPVTVGQVVDEILPFSLDDVTALLTAAWQTAVEVLPTLIVQDLFAVRPDHPPHIDLSLRADSERDEKLNRRDLRNMVDFSPFATQNSRQLTHLTATITYPLQLSANDRKGLVRQALSRMGAKAGFENALID
jgi:hypothetical protein